MANVPVPCQEVVLWPTARRPSARTSTLFFFMVASIFLAENNKWLRPLIVIYAVPSPPEIALRPAQFVSSRAKSLGFWYCVDKFYFPLSLYFNCIIECFHNVAGPDGVIHYHSINELTLFYHNIPRYNVL